MDGPGVGEVGGVAVGRQGGGRRVCGWGRREVGRLTGREGAVGGTGGWASRRRRSGSRIERRWAWEGQGGERNEQERVLRATSRRATTTAMPQSWSLCCSVTVAEKESERVQGSEGKRRVRRVRIGRKRASGGKGWEARYRKRPASRSSTCLVQRLAKRDTQ